MSKDKVFAAFNIVIEVIASGRQSLRVRVLKMKTTGMDDTNSSLKFVIYTDNVTRISTIICWLKIFDLSPLHMNPQKRVR